ncbi:M23 family metallopeptidase [Patescibacteria group bacterium]|nr:M23 family metallopeptidase [Patescibacteria group bacterium]MBU1970658.1 M23 family metallopeptidase [Patescibacteria group bacterium]
MIDPFLELPFKENEYKITGGWFYSDTDFITNTLRSNNHYAIDFELKRGTPVSAAASGWALTSYHHFLIKDQDDKRKFVRNKGELISSGQGNFIIIYHPKQELFTQYGHLENVNSSIPFYQSEKKRGKVIPPTAKFQPSFFAKPRAIWVEQGNLLGYVGTSGLRGNWSTPHFHFEVYRYRDKDGGKPKDSYVDPYDIYKSSNSYPFPNHKGKVGPNQLWLNIK